MSEIDAEAMIKAVQYGNARERLIKRGITEYQIYLLETAIHCARKVGEQCEIALALTIQKDSHWPEDHVEAVKSLINHGYVETTKDSSRYWLTPRGGDIHTSLESNLPKGRRNGETAEQTLRRCGCSESDIALLAQANDTGFGWAILISHSDDNRHQLKDQVGRLVYLNLVRKDPRDNGYELFYFLSDRGQEFRDRMAKERKNKKTTAVAVVSPELNGDLNLSRDGLMVTASKLWYLWTHRKEIKAQKHQEWLVEFAAGQGALDDTIAEILRPREPIILPPQTRSNPYWSEEMQRKQNDLYWINKGAAFWLNPHGLFAPETPAPNWWVEPDYTPKVQVADTLDSVVEASLLPPPTAHQTAPNVRPMNQRELAEHRAHKAEEHIREQVLKRILNAASEAKLLSFEPCDLDDDFPISIVLDDDITVIDLLLVVEEEFGISLDDSDFKSLLYLCDLVDAIITKQKNREAHISEIDELIEFIDNLKDERKHQKKLAQGFSVVERCVGPREYVDTSPKHWVDEINRINYIEERKAQEAERLMSLDLEDFVKRTEMSVSRIGYKDFE